MAFFQTGWLRQLLCRDSISSFHQLAVLPFNLPPYFQCHVRCRQVNCFLGYTFNHLIPHTHTQTPHNHHYPLRVKTNASEEQIKIPHQTIFYIQLKHCVFSIPLYANGSL